MNDQRLTHDAAGEKQKKGDPIVHMKFKARDESGTQLFINTYLEDNRRFALLIMTKEGRQSRLFIPTDQVNGLIKWTIRTMKFFRRQGSVMETEPVEATWEKDYGNTYLTETLKVEEEAPASGWQLESYFENGTMRQLFSTDPLPFRIEKMINDLAETMAAEPDPLPTFGQF